jgi:hypothetical protein
MAMLYGDFSQPGPYLVMMKWNPGWLSPGTYATDRIQVVVFGTWFISSWNLTRRSRHGVRCDGGRTLGPQAADFVIGAWILLTLRHY